MGRGGKAAAGLRAAEPFVPSVPAELADLPKWVLVKWLVHSPRTRRTPCAACAGRVDSLFEAETESFLPEAEAEAETEATFCCTTAPCWTNRLERDSSRAARRSHDAARLVPTRRNLNFDGGVLPWM